MTRTNPQQLAESASQLATLPRAYYRVQQMLDDDRYGAADIGKVIGHEPALTARLLRMVNSAYYALPSKIDTIPMAITVLGTKALRDLVLTTSVSAAFERIDTDLVNVAGFWHHSLYCGIMARLLSRRLRVGDSEQAFIGGLLHDIGKLVMYSQIPEESAALLRRLREDGRPLFQIEREELGFSHAEVGAALLRVWELPLVYQEIAACHHEPASADGFPEETALVCVANAVTKKVEPGHERPVDETDVPLLDAAILERVPVNAELLGELRVEADLQSIEVYGTLFGAADK
ncbi:HDOD domain-containing protein [Ectothiorhodospiraceae bacterium WFHF3C12]|nr:HDOD domain-containing protein [Ectothiorhodospiraceae bacterium WFHF3C12]